MTKTLEGTFKDKEKEEKKKKKTHEDEKLLSGKIQARTKTKCNISSLYINTLLQYSHRKIKINFLSDRMHLFDP